MSPSEQLLLDTLCEQFPGMPRPLIESLVKSLRTGHELVPKVAEKLNVFEKEDCLSMGVAMAIVAGHSIAYHFNNILPKEAIPGLTERILTFCGGYGALLGAHGLRAFKGVETQEDMEARMRELNGEPADDDAFVAR